MSLMSYLDGGHTWSWSYSCNIWAFRNHLWLSWL